MGMGIGAAMTGLRPIVEGMNMGFLLLAYNQISNNAGMLHYTSGGQFKVPALCARRPTCLSAVGMARAVSRPVAQACLPSLQYGMRSHAATSLWSVTLVSTALYGSACQQGQKCCAVPTLPG